MLTPKIQLHTDLKDNPLTLPKYFMNATTYWKQGRNVSQEQGQEVTIFQLALDSLVYRHSCKLKNILIVFI